MTFLQYAGDYREAFERLSNGGPETYQAQRYSVEFMASLPHRVTVVCGVSRDRYEAILPNGVRAIGAGLRNGFDERELIPFVADADRLILVTPVPRLLNWANRKKIKTLMMLADSFPAGGLIRNFRHRMLARDLNRTDFVGNHQRPAARSLERIGVDPRKIIPWDWPPTHKPDEYSPRDLKPGPVKLAYVGAISESKGVGDLLRALPPEAYLTLYGPKVDDFPEDRPNVKFAGTIPNADIATAMRSADIVVVPSRYEYPEGLPLTILEALATRTPLITSDHPMFELGDYVVRFKAGNEVALRSAIDRLSSDPALYARLSERSAHIWRDLQVPVTFGEMVTRWLDGDVNWLRRQTLGRFV